ncbi:MAG: flagellar hook-basal body complex protein [bacterium]
MLRSVYSGITGMRINQLWFDVIAGNMANVNTPGFKKSRISFQDLLNQSLEGAMPAMGETGGTNPMQVGLGSRVSVIQVVHTQGTVKETQVKTDLVINGEGYFIVEGDDGNNYTRAGNFTFDSVGNLINQSNGRRLLGWAAERDSVTGQLVIDANNKTKIDTSKPLEGLKINLEDIMSPKQTTNISFEKTLNSSAKKIFDPIYLNFVKYIKSVVPVSEEGSKISLDVSWDEANFENTPTGTITVGPEGSTKTFDLGSKPRDLINTINNNSATTGVSIEYSVEEDRFILKVDPKIEAVKSAGGRIVISETPAAGRTGFFTEAKIPTRTYHSSNDLRIDFDHLLDPENPNNFYLRWKAIDDSTNETISTNAYYYRSDDYGLLPGQVTGEVVGYTTVAYNATDPDDVKKRALVFELDNADIDPSTLQISVISPGSSTPVIYSPYKLPAREGDPLQTQYSPPLNSYYFDDNGQTEVIYPYNGTNGDAGVNIGKSKNGVDRIIFITHDDGLGGIEPGPPPLGSRIIADYMRNGFNLNSSSVDPTTLEIKIDDILEDKANYTFNNNLGVGGNDQITFFSTISSEEVARDYLDIDQPFESAGFNSAPNLVMPDDALDSTITIRWGSGADQFWTSSTLRSYLTVRDFLSTVTESVNSKIDPTGRTKPFEISYNLKDDRFMIKNSGTIYLSQDNQEGFLAHAKLPGEEGTAEASIAPNENPMSREEVVMNRLDLSKPFVKAGFNNGFEQADNITPPNEWITFRWTITKAGTSYTALWDSGKLGDYASVQEFIDDVNHAVVPETLRNTSNTNDAAIQGDPLPLTIRYDPNTDRFTMVNSELSMKVSQYTSNGFLTKAHLLTDGVDEVSVPLSPAYNRVVTADYNYNKTVEAKGILQLDADYKVINNFRDTESVPEITSSMEVIDGIGIVNLGGGWDQFDSGTINGTITIETDSGKYISNEINLTYYPTVQSLLDEINSSDAMVAIEYDSSTDKFKISSKTEGARISLSETGTVPFFSEVNISLGTIEGGNNNSVMDLETERPIPEDGWADTTSAAGTGRDFIRINVASNEVKDEELGRVGAGKWGANILKEKIGTFPAAPAEPVVFDLFHSDVDEDTVVVYYYEAGAPAGHEIIMIPKEQVVFLDNEGTAGRDAITIEQSGTIPANDSDIWVDYTRVNAFDLKNPDVDPTTLVLRVNNVVQDASKFTFQDGGGSGGVDRIILDEAYTSGNIVEVEYRQVNPPSSDVFIPNGNFGAESLVFTPNTSVDNTYIGYKSSDEGDSVTAQYNEGYFYLSPAKIYDSLGKLIEISYRFERFSQDKWLWSILNPVDNNKFAGYGIVAFKEGNYDKENSKVFESPSDEQPAGTRFKGVYFSSPGAVPSEITTDFTKLHQFAQTDTKASKSDADTSQDGYGMGKLQEKSINAKGIIVGKYTNEQVQELGQIGLATFSNPSGLFKTSATFFTETLNSGKTQIGTPGEGGFGSIQSGALEMANVDLVEEFTDLIIAQRAFQANSRIIVTDDQILTEIVNMKR